MHGEEGKRWSSEKSATAADPLGSPFSRAHLLRLIAAASLLLGIAFTYKIWLNSPLLPYSPFLDFIPPIPFPFDYLLLAAILSFLVASMFQPKKYLVVALLLLAFAYLQNQGRLFPPFYMYTFLLAILAFVPWSRPEEKMRWDGALNASRFVLASMYLWTGIQKINPLFVSYIVPRIFNPISEFSEVIAQAASPFVKYGAPAIPYIEIAIGIGLITRGLRTPALYATLFMHAILLWFLGPIQYNEAHAAWAWNISSVALVLVLFARSSTGFKETLFPKTAPHFAAIVFFGIMPIFSLFNLWDSYPSFNVYSGNVALAEIRLSAESAKLLPKSISQYMSPEQNGEILVLDNPRGWFVRELNSDVYPETRNFKNIFRKICGLVGDDPGAELLVKEKMSVLDSERKIKRYHCDEL